MKQKIYPPIIGALSVFLLSCGNETVAPKMESIISDTITKNNHTVVEHQVANLDPAYEKLVAAFEENKTLPLTIDKKFIEKLEPKKQFHKEEVALLTANYIKHDLCLETDLAIKHFYEVDSVKKTGTYEDWSNSLDLGQIKSSEAYPLFKVSNGAEVFLFWCLDYSTVEACPYGWTKAVYLTIISNNVPGETVVFAENSGGGDAPISSEKNITGTLRADYSIMISVKDELDQDEPFIEVTEALYELNTIAGDFAFIKEEKKPIKKVKKKTNN